MVKISLLLLLLFSLVSCTKKQKTTKSDTIVFCSEGSPKLFNPQLADDGTTIMATESTIYNQLIMKSAKDLNTIPGIATKWEISKDKLEYTFTLGKNISFHTTDYFTPTRKLNADDVIWTYNRMRDKSHPYHRVSGGNYSIFNSLGFPELIKDIVIIDDHKIRFILSQPNSTFLVNLTHGINSILSKEYGELLLKNGKTHEIDLKPIGTGPYKFKKYVKDTSIFYTAHKDYFLGEAKTKKLVFSITPNATVRFQKLKTSECHISIDPAPADIQAIKDHKDIELLTTVGMNLGYLGYNMRKKPLDNIKVRQAIELALDKPKYIRLIYNNRASVATTAMPSTVWGFNKSIKMKNTNIEAAKKLLKEAGFDNGIEISLWTLPVSRPYNPNGKKMGELMMEDLKKIGIKVKLITYKWATFLEKTAKGEHDLVQLGWSTTSGDPDGFLGMLLVCDSIKTGLNVSGWCNKEYDKLIAKGKFVTDKVKRTALYEKAQAIAAQELPISPIATAKIFRGARKEVQGYHVNPLGIERFNHIVIK